MDVARVQGPDPVAALQKLVSADLRGLAHGEVRGTLLLHPRGQFRALLAVGLWHGEVWVFAPPGFGQRAWEQLQRYLQFSRCRVTPSDGPCTVLVGAGWREALQGSEFSQPAGGGEPPVFAETLMGLPGGVVLANVGQERQEIAPQELELLRIQAGFPAWGKELTDDVLPQEVGLREPWVSLTKGCYIGQETMARLATYGHVNRLLVRLAGQADDSSLETLGSLPWPLTVGDNPKPVGRLTSWASLPGGELLALGLVHRTVAREGQELQAGETRFTVQAVLA